MKEQLAPGVWVGDDGSLNIDVKLVAQHLGIPFNAQNQAMIMAAAIEVLKENHPNMQFEEVIHDDP